MTNHLSRHEPRPLRRAVTAALLGAAALGATSAQAFDFTLGSWNGNWDTTLSYGQLYRVQNRDLDLIGTANGGIGRSPNIDDGNLNYDTGMVSNAAKFVTEFALNKDTFGLFLRAQGLYDFEVMKQPTQRTPLSEDAKDLVGSYVRMLDYFIYGRFYPGGRELDLRAGSMVVNWGESTFIPGVNSTINHFDLSALRVPGSELREAYLPQEMAKISFGMTENLTFEALYLFSWDETRPEPVGSFFSSNDFAVEAGETVFLGFGAYSDQGVDFDFGPVPGAPLVEGFQGVPRSPTREASNDGQYGAALKWFLPNFSSGTELGLYFMNYHSKVPLISGRTGTRAGLANAGGVGATVQATVGALVAGLPPAAAIAIGASQGRDAAAAAGGNLSLETATGYATIAANTAIGGGNVSAQGTNLATHEYAKTATYFTEYPEDIKLIGLSFNTQVGTTGVALQGEVSYRMDVPLQYDDVEVLFAALAPLENASLAGAGITPPATCTAALPTLAACNQIGRFGIDEEIQGWGEFDVLQAQLTGTKLFGPMLGAAQIVTVLEAAVVSVQSFPSKFEGGPNDRGLRFNGPGTSVSGNKRLAGRHFGEVEPLDRFADATSWGYRLAIRADYLGLIGPWNVSPRLVWAHDVRGTSPGPGGPFVDGRTGLTLGVNANLLAKWEVDASYTRFDGAGRWNDINDRDFVAATVKYSF